MNTKSLQNFSQPLFQFLVNAIIKDNPIDILQDSPIVRSKPEA